MVTLSFGAGAATLLCRRQAMKGIHSPAPAITRILSALSPAVNGFLDHARPEPAEIISIIDSVSAGKNSASACLAPRAALVPPRPPPPPGLPGGPGLLGGLVLGAFRPVCEFGPCGRICVGVGSLLAGSGQALRPRRVQRPRGLRGPDRGASSGVIPGYPGNRVARVYSSYRPLTASARSSGNTSA
jgi:hypothetical protein